MFNELHTIHLNELRGENHAGKVHYDFVIKERDQIPNEMGWAFPGRILLFFGERVERNGDIYIPAMCYIKGLIYCSFAHPSGWEERLVPLDKDGIPLVKYGKEDLSMYYRYVVVK